MFNMHDHLPSDLEELDRAWLKMMPMICFFIIIARLNMPAQYDLNTLCFVLSQKLSGLTTCLNIYLIYIYL